jgi:hypothetical protein
MKNKFKTLIVSAVFAVAFRMTPQLHAQKVPDPASVDTIAGTWEGTWSDNSGPGPVTLHLKQSGKSISGTFSASDPLCPVTFSGKIMGKLRYGIFTFAMYIPTARTSSQHQKCSMALTGRSTSLTVAKMTGTYSGNDSCGGAFDNGSFSMTKR